jgi:hypothetical protein
MASRLRQFAARFTEPPVIGRAWDDPELLAASGRVGKGELRAGQQLLAVTRTDPDSRSLRIRALADAAVEHVDGLAWLSKEHPDDPDLALWLGVTRIQQAWKIRSGRLASQVSQDTFEAFWLVLGGVAEPLERAARLLPNDPTPWEYLLWRGLGLQVDRTEIDGVWAELSRRAPFSYSGCSSRVQVLCAKWQGSNEEVLEFAEGIAAAAPPGHPVVTMLVAAHLEVAAQNQVFMSEYFPSVHDRIAGYADAWIADPMRHPRTIEAHHMFGAILYFADDHARAARHLRQVSPKTLPSSLPWSVRGENFNYSYREIRWRLGLD